MQALEFVDEGMEEARKVANIAPRRSKRDWENGDNHMDAEPEKWAHQVKASKVALASKVLMLV